MQFEDILYLIQRYRPLTGCSSLPFWKCNTDNSPLYWFTYDIRQTETTLNFSVDKLYAYSEDGKIIEAVPNLQIQVALEEYDEQAISEDEYVQQLEVLPRPCTETELFRLLEQAELHPILPVYRAVLQYLQQN